MPRRNMAPRFAATRVGGIRPRAATRVGPIGARRRSGPAGAVTFSALGRQLSSCLPRASRLSRLRSGHVTGGRTDGRTGDDRRSVSRDSG